MLWKGKGRIVVDDPAKTLDEGKNRLSIEVPPHTEFVLDVVEVDPKAPVHDVSVVPEALEKTFEKDVFNPHFLERLAPFSVIRFLEWSRINGSGLKRWEDRPRPEWTFQSTDAGVAYEYQIDLVNRLESDLWLCVPHLADDDFVKNLAQLVEKRLRPAGKVYVEWSNEVWNDAGPFTQSKYARERGRELKLEPDDENVARLRFQARRSKQVFQIFSSVIKKPGRLVRVVASQNGNVFAHRTLLDFEGLREVTDALAVAPYFGNEIGAADREAWLKRSSPEEILDHLEKKSLPEVVGWIQDSAKVAKSYGIDLIAYEGGQHLVASPDIHNNPGVNEKLDAVNRHPRMKKLTLQLLEAWRASGGKTFVYYSFASPPGKWGRFGALEYLDQPVDQANKYAALLEFMKANPTWW